MTTPVFSLTEWAAAQASPWLPHNEALRVLEAVTRGSVTDRDLTAPPGTCADGAAYLIAATATGAWATHDGKMAIAVGTNAASGWLFAVVAVEGMSLWIEDEAFRINYIGAAWAAADALALQSYTVAGVPSASGRGAGAMIYVTDETGGAVPAFSDATNWRRVTDRAIVS